MAVQNDVIVLGAGAAGIAAADALARRKISVRLLEARNRYGGRILSEWPAGWPEPIELGAEFIHGGNRALARLLRRAGLPTRKLRPAMWWWERGALRAVPEFWDKICRAIDRVPKSTQGDAFADFLRKHGDELPALDRRIAQHYIASFNAGPLEGISAVAMRAGHAGADSEDRKVRGRYVCALENVVRNWGGRVDLRLGRRATRVEWRDGAVTVTACNEVTGKLERHTARAVIVTLPLGVLRAGALKFSPALPAKRRLFDRIGWGYATRVLLRFAPDFWRRGFLPARLRENDGRGFGFVNAPELPLPVWWATNAPAPVLTGWAGGPASERLDHLPLPQLRRAAIGSLARLANVPPKAVAAQLLDLRTHAWADDPLTRGAYSYAAAGAENAPAQLAVPVRGTIFFAGEAMAEEAGTVHGAVATGLRAAKEVRKAL